MAASKPTIRAETRHGMTSECHSHAYSVGRFSGTYPSCYSIDWLKIFKIALSAEKTQQPAVLFACLPRKVRRRTHLHSTSCKIAVAIFYAQPNFDLDEDLVTSFLSPRSVESMLTVRTAPTGILFCSIVLLSQ